VHGYATVVHTELVVLIKAQY